MTKVGKYGNRRTVIGLETFDSKAESLDWIDLRLREKAGQISQLRRQVRIVLYPAFVDAHRMRHPAITYIADFVYVEEGQLTITETKGIETPAWRLKRGLLSRLHPEYRLIVHYVESKRRSR